MVHCFYHSADLDGICSGFICAKYHEINRMPYTLHPYNYGQAVPYNQIDKLNDRIIFADVVPSPYDELERMIRSGYYITILDHHASLIEFVQHLPMHVDGILSSETSACGLCWNYFFDDPLPEFIKLLSLYDSWNNKDADLWDQRVVPFQYGARLYAKDPSEDRTWWDDCFKNKYDSEYVNDIIKQGKICVKYKDQYDEKLCHSSFVAKMQAFPQYKCLCLNSSHINSITFQSKWDVIRHDIMLAYSFNGRQYNISLYTTKPEIDVSKICGYWGGGGHIKAAGFQVSDIKFNNGEIMFIK